MEVSEAGFIEWRRRTVTAAQKLKPIHRVSEVTAKILNHLTLAAPDIDMHSVLRMKDNALYDGVLRLCQEAWSSHWCSVKAKRSSSLLTQTRKSMSPTKRTEWK